MRKLLIQNSGLIKPEHLTLIGASTKRNNSSTIGQFGSGNKYGLAVCLRENVDVQIFSGTDEIDLDFNLVPFDMEDGNQQFLRCLTVNGQATSITHEMGALDWTMWMALREFISNALDAGGFEMKTIYGEIPKEMLKPGHTSLILEYNNDVDEIMRNYGNYFAFERRATGMTQIDAHLYYRNKEKRKPIIYRKGIRCYDDLDIESRFDFNFSDIRINESRLASINDVRSCIRQVLCEMNAEDMLDFIREDHSYPYYPDYLSSKMIANFKHLIKDEGLIVAPKFLESFGPLLGYPSKTLYIRNAWYEKLVKLDIIKASDDINTDMNYVVKEGYDTQDVENLLSKVNLGHIQVVSAAFDSWGSIKRVNSNTVVVKHNSTLTPVRVAAEIVQTIQVEDVFKIFE